MKRAFILSATCLAFAACGGPQDTSEPSADAEQAGNSTARTAETSFEDDCLVVANDVEGKQEITEMGTDPEGFCACAEEFLAEMPQSDQDNARTTMKNVAASMKESGDDTETVVGQMMAEAMAKGEDPDAKATAEGIRIVGGMIDNIDDSFEETGSCTVG
ncbi:hypothetical protein [Henriciella sp.]|uniref:hypothetical protein n=1 Tax=Henriciella sp. TaxID=1968823 RepID=UPI00262C1AB0|nr:hypothetical protein [Henriciella sp.]